jgi:DHA2 family multidrug resistance protein
MVSTSTPANTQPVFSLRLACGLLGILLAAMMSGLNNRVAGLGLPDIRGNLGFAFDDASWLDSLYSAGELAAMPFATWFAITFSLRRFHLTMLCIVMVIALFLPGIKSLPLLMIMRTVQGLFAGTLVPLLMMSALRFLPLPIRIHGFALYAMTATFSPNVALWLTAICVDKMNDWRWIYWQVIPIGLIALPLVAWGIPKMPLMLNRLPQANWLAMVLGIPGLGLLAITMSQGVRLDWFHSPVIIVSLLLGVTFTLLFLCSEWLHPAPFIKIQLLKRRNLGLGFTIFFCLLVTMSSAVALPLNILEHLQSFRMEQLAPIGLVVGLPQLLLGSLVALLLYQQWVDARHVFIIGLLCISCACWLASQITDEWIVHQFIWPQVLQAIGQPMAVVSMLFLSTSVVQPMEGAYVSGIVNTIRAFGSLFSGAFIGQLMTFRGAFHNEMLLDNFGRWFSQPLSMISIVDNNIIAEQSAVLSIADVYLIFAIIALILIPCVYCLQHISAPKVHYVSKDTSTHK